MEGGPLRLCAAWGGSGDVDENNRKAAAVEGAGKSGGAIEDGRSALGNAGDDAFLQIDENEGSVGIESRKRDGDLLRYAACL